MTRFKKNGFLALLAVVVLLQLSQLCQAQDIYLLPVVGGPDAEGKDNGYLNAAEQSVGNICAVFQSNVPWKNLIIYGNPKKWPGQQKDKQSLTGPELRNAIKTCPAGSNDTIVVYWAGHGRGDRVTERHYLQMANGQLLERYSIVNDVLKKRVRLSVIITDTCAESVAGPGAFPAIAAAVVISPLFDELFIKARGLVDISSASPGEYAFAITSPLLGCLFSQVLACPRVSLEENPHLNYLARNRDERKKWPEVIGELQGHLDAWFKECQSSPNASDLMKNQERQTIWVVTRPLPGEATITTTTHCCCCQRCGLLKRLIQRIRARRAARRCCCGCCCN